MACPRCFYANDEHFRYCQNCGYARVQVEGALAGDRVRIDQEMIAGRLDELAKQRGSSSYIRQKSSLEKELCSFLSSKSPAKSLESAIPGDLLEFLVWKDRRGRTQVHCAGCQGGACNCSKRLAFGTVDSLIGKLRAIFLEHGRGAEWHSVLNIGNPASHWSVKRYLADIRKNSLRPGLCHVRPSLCFWKILGVFQHVYMHSLSLWRLPLVIFIFWRGIRLCLRPYFCW